MISPSEIKAKASKIWESQRIQRAYLSKEILFPIHIPLPKFSAKTMPANFQQIRTWITSLRDNSKTTLGYGYEITFKENEHRQLGHQSVPSQIYFTDATDFLRFINKQKDYQNFCKSVDLILSRQPQLKEWLDHNSEKVLLFSDKWNDLLTICDYFQQNPHPKKYLRELDIAGIDTKFIEQNKKILTELLDQVLPASAINREMQGYNAHNFEQRYGLNYDDLLIRFRILDKELASHLGVTDLSLPLKEFRHLSLPCQRIFITENKINGLAFPPLEKSIVIFGLGYGIQSLQNIDWMTNKQIFYWGDIDTHGFAMLSQLRGYYPATQAMMMDHHTLNAFRSLWVQEPAAKRCLAELPNLTAEEQILYKQLRGNFLGENIRLEQERISFDFFLTQLNLLKAH